ncbi:hypothetical protein C3489_05415 [Streptomyces sp. Ru71]|uniref:copper chaperone PCu(A)C n=1 Tax=Streptomyces sp. Ru71 TaxID=2080746 RepID=UPI000CDE46BE|nr:copper chaperone PCu(A)C [Streptomyces sp. Ru71]POX56515.1 hypothetical protein C3489_05415 [Streptomyces sp. Ru71]
MSGTRPGRPHPAHHGRPGRADTGRQGHVGVRWPTRRRVADALRAAFAPLAACVLALGGLVGWVGGGWAGSPARVAVVSGRVFLPYGGTTQTAAFFDLANPGGADDRLVQVTSPAVDGTPALSRHRAAGAGTAAKAEVDTATVPAGGTLSMSPHGVDVTLPARAEWRLGDRVPFTLRFERSGTIETVAVVVRPGGRLP